MTWLTFETPWMLFCNKLSISSFLINIKVVNLNHLKNENILYLFMQQWHFLISLFKERYIIIHEYLRRWHYYKCVLKNEILLYLPIRKRKIMTCISRLWHYYPVFLIIKLYYTYLFKNNSFWYLVSRMNHSYTNFSRTWHYLRNETLLHLFF